ncbi:MAG TPA: OmpW family outer membrane protein [Wenzhouxiangella sp.]
MIGRFFVLLVTLTLSAQLWAYEAGDWLVRVGVGYVEPDTSSNDLSVAGTALPGYQIDVDDNMRPIVSLTYMASEHIGVEVLAAWPFQHDINGAAALDGIGKLGETKHLPPTVSVQYHLFPQATFRPYVGVGLNYTTFFSTNTTATLEGALGGSSQMNIKDSYGLALQLGADFDVSENWFFNLDLRYVQIEADARIKTQTQEGLVRSQIKADLDPLVLSAGFSRRC